MEEKYYYENLLPEISPFPLTEESVNRSLKEILTNPFNELSRTLDVLTSENPNILTIITASSQFKGENTEIFEGGIFAYKLIRDLAVSRDTKIPVLGKEAGSCFIFNFHQDIFERGTLKINDLVQKKINEIKEIDPEFITGITEMRKYSAKPNDFYYGAVMIYSAIKYTEQYQ